MIMPTPKVIQKREKLLDDFHELMISLELAKEVDIAIQKAGSTRQFLHPDGEPMHWSEIFLRHHETLLEILRSRSDVDGVKAFERVVQIVRDHIPLGLITGVGVMEPVWESPFLVFRSGGSEVRIPMSEGPATRGIERFHKERNKLN